MPNEVKLLPCEELVESVKQSLEDVFYDTLNCAFDADLLARAAIEAMPRPTTVVTDEVVERVALIVGDKLGGHEGLGEVYRRNGDVRWKQSLEIARASIDSMPTVVTGEQPQSAFNVLVDLHDALVMTREHNPHTHVISFVDHAAEFDRATKFLRAAQPGDA